jgi:tight adherence protein C
MAAGVWISLVLAISGAAIVLATMVGSRRDTPDLGEFLNEFRSLERPKGRPVEPLLARVAGGSWRAVAARLERMLPANYIAGLDRRLAQAGLSHRRRPGQQLGLQLGLAAAGAVMALLLPVTSPLWRGAAWVLFPAIGFMVPAVLLNRAVQRRSDAIFKDLPDIVDMLAIAVEAGTGFEAALSLVCQNFASPLTDELSMMLHEMELGVPRRQALQHLRDRVDMEVVGTLVLTIIQADGLGIPIGRVLSAQANEVRARRRAWAREKAAKLPVKIMFPLVLFIFPPIMGIVLGPAVASFGKLGS